MADNLNLADFYFKKYQNMSAIEKKKKKKKAGEKIQKRGSAKNMQILSYPHCSRKMNYQK